MHLNIELPQVPNLSEQPSHPEAKFGVWGVYVVIVPEGVTTYHKFIESYFGFIIRNVRTFNQADIGEVGHAN
jgi:hypothetical protein